MFWSTQKANQEEPTAPSVMTSECGAQIFSFEILTSATGQDQANDVPLSQTETDLPKRGGRGRQKSTKNYTDKEIAGMLEVAAQYLPIGQLEWEKKVAVAHNDKWQTNRSGESLKRKFDALASSKVPTGDPLCPENVKVAKVPLHVTFDVIDFFYL